MKIKNIKKLFLLVVIVAFAVFSSGIVSVQAKSSVAAGVAAGSGLENLSLPELTAYIDDMDTLNMEWARFDLPWTSIETADGVYDWAKYDVLISRLNARNIKMLVMVGYTPAWARPPGCASDNKCAPQNISDYTDFLATAVSRYKDQGVKHWEVWNEPNIATFWKPAPDVTAYTSMLTAAYSAAKAVDSASVIISGGTSPAVTNGTNIAPIDFMSGMYANGAKNYFDAFGHHPYCFVPGFDCPDDYAAWSAWSQMQDTPINLRSIMAANGDSAKKIWATEFGAPTSGSGAISESEQADMVRDSHDLFSTYSWAGPLFWYSLKDTGTNVSNREHWFGLRRFDGSKKPSFDVFAAAYEKPAVPNVPGSGSPPIEQASEPSSTPNPDSSPTTHTYQLETTAGPVVDPSADELIYNESIDNTAPNSVWGNERIDEQSIVDSPKRSFISISLSVAGLLAASVAIYYRFRRKKPRST